jgi:anti-sigma factor RsiW
VRGPQAGRGPADCRVNPPIAPGDGDDRVASVRAKLSENPGDVRPGPSADRHHDRALLDEVRVRPAPVAREPAPSWLGRLRGADRLRTVSGLAITSLLVALAGAAGWFARDFTGGPNPIAGRAWAGLASEALSAHRTFAVEVAHPVEIRADQEAYLTQWLSGRLRRPLVVPDLSEAFGFRFLGGRLLPAGAEVAALLMYADTAGTRLTLYVRGGESEPVALHFRKEGEIATFSWIEGGTGFAVAAPLEREALAKVAKAVSQAYDLDAVRRRRAL